jgi:ribosome biogenesis GTPase
LPPETPETVGLVIRIDAKFCHVEVGDRTYLLSPRGRLFEPAGAVKNPIAVGDRVRVILDAQGGGNIDSVLPRTTRLARTAAGDGQREQVMVANVDQVIVVASTRQPGFRAEIVDRILAGAEREGIAARLVVNKVDLEPADERRSSATWCEFYRGLGYPSLATSAVTGAGVDELRTALHNRLSVFCGPSGVGKSSLLNAVEPELSLRVGKVSGGGAREGRHTTTHSSLLRVRGGGHVVDTPGIRNFGLFGLEPSEVWGLFVEMRECPGRCAFADCTHSHEPDCRIRKSLAEGKIAESRYASYRELLAEAREGGF